MSRGQEGDKTLIMQLSEGVVGALRVMSELVRDFGPAPLLDLQEAGIKGSDIWVLFKYQCGESHEKMVDALKDKSAIAMLKKNKLSSFYKKSKK